MVFSRLGPAVLTRQAFHRSCCSVTYKGFKSSLHGWDDTWTYLCFSSKGCHIADLLRPQCVDDWALSHIRIANETHTYLFLVCVELWEAKNKVRVLCFLNNSLSLSSVHEGNFRWGSVAISNKRSELVITPELQCSLFKTHTNGYL